MEKYFFLMLVAALAFVLLFWFKKTPRAESKSDSEKRLFEHESKIVRLYQNLEDLMNSFENYVEEEKRGIHADRERIERMAQDTREASERLSRAMDILGAMGGAGITGTSTAPQDASPEGAARAAARPDAKMEAKANARPDAKTDAKANTRPDVKTDAKATARPDAKMDAKAGARAEAMIGARAQANTDTDGVSGGEAEGAPASTPKPRTTKTRPSLAEASGGAAGKAPAKTPSAQKRSATSRVAAAPQPGMVSEPPPHMVRMPLEETSRENLNVNWIGAPSEPRGGTMERAAVRSYTAAINTKASAESIAFMEIAELARANMQRERAKAAKKTGGNAQAEPRPAPGTQAIPMPTRGGISEAISDAVLEPLREPAIGPSRGSTGAALGADPESADTLERVELPTDEAFEPLSVPRARRKKPTAQGSTGPVQTLGMGVPPSSSASQTPVAGEPQIPSRGAHALPGGTAHAITGDRANAVPRGATPEAPGNSAHAVPGGTISALGGAARVTLSSVPRQAAARRSDRPSEPALDAHELLRLLTADTEQNRRARTGENSLIRKTEQATRLYAAGTAPEEIARALSISLTEVKMLLGLTED